MGRVEEISSDWLLISQVSLHDFTIDQTKNSTKSQGESVEVSDSVVSALTTYYEEDFLLFGYDKPDANDFSIKVTKSKVGLSFDQIEYFKSDIKNRRMAFTNLADRLKSGPEFRGGYLHAQKQKFNQFMIFSNHVNSKTPSDFQKFKNLVRNNIRLNYK